MFKKSIPLVLTAFLVCPFLAAPVAQAESVDNQWQLAQLPMQQQTDDPHLQKMLDASVADAALTWTVPQGWNETKGAGMRMATFKSRDGDGMECSVVALKGMAGGIEDNILRWMTQIGLDVPGDQFTAFLKNLEQINIREDVSATVVDLTRLQDPEEVGRDSMIAAILQLPTETVFFKMTGSLGVVKQNEEQFRALISSLIVSP